jgi:CubicO group peptidase (beta-lactamase class C family)
MKKIIYSLLAMLVIISAQAQIFVPGENSISSDNPTRQKLLYGPIQPGNILWSEYDGNAASNLESLRTPGVKGQYYRSPAFDSTWAEQLQQALDEIMAANNIPGASLSVYDPVQGLFTGVSGISTEGVPITPEMRFGIGSNTKLFVAVTLLKLQEEGILTLDDHLYQWLPSYAYIDSSATIRQMLLHQSGFFDFWNDNFTLLLDSVWADTSRFWTADEVLATIGPPHFAPGKGYSYCNTNYTLAALVIEAATGVTWVQALHEYIFDPLVMDSTFVGAFEPRNGPVSSEYDYFSGIEITNSPMTAEYSQAHAAGGILSTAQEMASWYSALFSGNLINTNSMEQLTDFDPISMYGLALVGYEYPPLNIRVYNHSGGMLGYISLVWYDANTGAVFAVLYNGQDIIQNPFDPLITTFHLGYPKQMNDAGITKIINPWLNFCNGTVTPEVVLKNHGSSPLTSVEINYFLDQEPASTYSWTGFLNTSETVHIVLEPLTAGDGLHSFTCLTSSPNGEPEGYTFNDTVTSNFIMNLDPAIAAPFVESFEGEVFPPEGWSQNLDRFHNWGRITLAAYDGTGSIAKNNFDDYDPGADYILDLPLINISGGIDAALDFTYAYAKFPGVNGDSLQILISPDCGLSWDILFHKGGDLLATAPSTYNLFYPKTPGDWQEESIPLTGYTGEVLIRFRAVNGVGNNLYLDDIRVNIAIGTGENHLPVLYSAYPNPVKSRLNVAGLLRGTEIILTDITGNILIRTEAGNKTTIIDLQSFADGIYILKTAFGSRKIVKMD